MFSEGLLPYRLQGTEYKRVEKPLSLEEGEPKLRTQNNMKAKLRAGASALRIGPPLVAT